MKKLVKKIGKNKFQFILFVGILAFVLVALIIAGASSKPNTETPVIDNTPDDSVDEPVSNDVEEVITLPFSKDLDYTVTRMFYDKTASASDQEKSLIKYGTTFRTSDGVAYSSKDNQTFDVLAVLSGKVVEVKNNPLYGTYVVVEHDNGIRLIDDIEMSKPLSLESLSTKFEAVDNKRGKTNAVERETKETIKDDTKKKTSSFDEEFEPFDFDKAANF
jgi:stage II sporulation protein Q